MNIVIEYHYEDGDVGVYPYPDKTAENLWNDFDKNGSSPSHIIIRQNNEHGQHLSNTLLEAVR